MNEEPKKLYGKDLCKALGGHDMEWIKHNRPFHGIEVYAQCTRCFERAR